MRAVLSQPGASAGRDWVGDACGDDELEKRSISRKIAPCPCALRPFLAVGPVGMKNGAAHLSSVEPCFLLQVLLLIQFLLQSGFYPHICPNLAHSLLVATNKLVDK